VAAMRSHKGLEEVQVQACVCAVYIDEQQRQAASYTESTRGHHVNRDGGNACSLIE
jgi:hypothetical protein